MKTAAESLARARRLLEEARQDRELVMRLRRQTALAILSAELGIMITESDLAQSPFLSHLIAREVEFPRKTEPDASTVDD